MNAYRSWRARERGESERFETLHDGVPTWLQSSLWAWFVEALRTVLDHYRDSTSADIVRILERSVRDPLGSDDVAQYGVTELQSTLIKDEMLFLDVVDAFLVFLTDYWGEKHVERLNTILEHGGSLWRADVGRDRARLVRRVDESAEQLAVATAASGTTAAKHLSRAWGWVYGRNPDASNGYHEAIRAVEAAAQPVVEPTNAKATLGTMISALRAKPSKWRLVLLDRSPDQQIQNVIGMMEAIWNAQHDRHGSADDEKPLHVSQGEAEAALAIAVTLVHLFTTGAVARA